MHFGLPIILDDRKTRAWRPKITATNTGHTGVERTHRDEQFFLNFLLLGNTWTGIVLYYFVTPPSQRHGSKTACIRLSCRAPSHSVKLLASKSHRHRQASWRQNVHSMMHWVKRSWSGQAVHMFLVTLQHHMLTASPCFHCDPRSTF